MRSWGVGNHVCSDIGLGIHRLGRDLYHATRYSEEVMVMASEKQESKGRGASGLVFVGCLMLGLAAGFLTGSIVAGLFGGLGVGFVGMGIVRASTGEW